MYSSFHPGCVQIDGAASEPTSVGMNGNPSGPMETLQSSFLGLPSQTPRVFDVPISFPPTDSAFLPAIELSSDNFTAANVGILGLGSEQHKIQFDDSLKTTSTRGSLESWPVSSSGEHDKIKDTKRNAALGIDDQRKMQVADTEDRTHFRDGDQISFAGRQFYFVNIPERKKSSLSHSMDGLNLQNTAGMHEKQTEPPP